MSAREDQIAARILAELNKDKTQAAPGARCKLDRKSIPVGISNRHLHLCRADLDALFGSGYELSKKNDLSQKGEFASNELVTLTGPRGSIEKVRVLGPLRPETQIEISPTDARRLGVMPPVRLSGDTKGTPGLTIKGPAGEVKMNSGLIIAKRHLHANPEQAKVLGLRDGDVISIRALTERPTIFEGVSVRVRPSFEIELHIDVDEANAAMINNGDSVEIVRK